MSDFECFIMTSVKDPLYNGGYGHVGDGNMKVDLTLIKDGIFITLDENDVRDLMVALRSINPTIIVS